MARACFVRILKLDPTNIESYIGLAVIYDREEKY